MSLGAALGAGSLGTGLALRSRGKGRTTVITLGKGYVDDLEGPVGYQDPYSGEWISTGTILTPVATKKITHVPGQAPKILGAAASAAMFKTAGLIMSHAFRFPEQERRIGVDKQLGAADLAVNSLAIDTKFIEKQINHQLAINQKTNIYSNPIINEREIMESFMDKDEWHGKKLKPAHLVCFIPSEEQLVALRSFKEEYGVLCDIPDYEMDFYEGMEPDIVRFRNLDNEAIKGLPNNEVRT